ncbi:MAG: class E sortase [Acidimicrobiia bacterium]
MRRGIQVFGWTLIWSGVFIFGYLGWQIFGTDLVNNGVQAEAHDELSDSFAGQDAESGEVIDPAEFVGPGQQVPEQTPDSVRFFDESSPGTGEAFAFIRIPKIDVDEVVFEGVDRQTLKSGPGHMEGTPLPGQAGNSVLSGHRTTHGRPFFDFDQLVVGDEIEVESSIGTHVYEVAEVRIVKPTDVWVTDVRPGGWLTLTTCHPKFSARERLVVWAKMVSGPNLDYVKLHEATFPVAS